MKTWIFFICLSFPIMLQAQSNWFKEAKGVALCECIRQMNLLSDSISATGQKDYSLSYFIQMTDLPPQLVDDIVRYVKINYTHFVEVPQEIGGNMIGISCWKYYHSKELDAYIRKIVKRYKLLKKKGK